jgi:transcriptional regulator with XRE-family HTH domain
VGTVANQKREEFVNWLDAQVQRAGGLRAAASKAGVSHATLLRGLQGEPLSLTTLEGISRWTGVSLIRLLRLYGEELEEDKRVEAALARTLDQHPELRQTLEEAIDVLDDQALAEVINFIQFQVERKKRRR